MWAHLRVEKKRPGWKIQRVRRIKYLGVEQAVVNPLDQLRETVYAAGLDAEANVTRVDNDLIIPVIDGGVPPHGKLFINDFGQCASPQHLERVNYSYTNHKCLNSSCREVTALN
jgi:hypothetical protein